jgi:predicted regulator of Ras-like GTPase activity (Roadblock/LC7/MglB family)
MTVVSIDFEHLLGRITRIRGVVGAVVLDAEDGLVVSESIMEGVRVNAVAALTASVYRRISQATRAAGQGAPDFVQMNAEQGILIATSGAEGTILAVIGELDVNVGLVRVEIRGILGRQ